MAWERKRPEYKLFKQHVLAKCLQTSDSLETLFLFVTLFYLVPLFFFRSNKNFSFFSNRGCNRAPPRIKCFVLGWHLFTSTKCKEWKWIRDKGILYAQIHLNTHTNTHTPVSMCSIHSIYNFPQILPTCLKILNAFCQSSYNIFLIFSACAVAVSCHFCFQSEKDSTASVRLNYITKACLSLVSLIVSFVWTVRVCTIWASLSLAPSPSAIPLRK